MKVSEKHFPSLREKTFSVVSLSMNLTYRSDMTQAYQTQIFEIRSSFSKSRVCQTNIFKTRRISVKPKE